MSSKSIPKIILAVSLAAVYLAGMARGLTWANQGSDGGDLVTAAATGGVAHPSGYPTYLLFARLFQLLPIGSLAFRTNLMSGFAAVCVALVVYEIVSKSHNRLAGLASAYGIGLSPLFWSQAVITEVYVLHVLFIALILFQSAKDPHNHFLLGLTFGLGMGNHITTVFMLPVIFRKEKLFLFQRFMGTSLGLLVYISLPLRAMSHPPINWGNPVTLENFIWLVTGKLYQDQLFTLAPAAIWGRIQTTAALCLEQFGFIGLLIGLTGLIVFYQPISLHRNMIWTASIFLIFPLTYGTGDSFLYLLPVFLCLAIWIGIGLGSLMDAAAQRSRLLGVGVGLAFLSVLFIQAVGHWPQVDASRDQRAENFGREMMVWIPKDAIVFAKGDQAVLTLWYFHYALHNRPDIAIIATDLLQYEWYQETIRNNYPGLDLPDYFFMFTQVITAFNPDRTICYVKYDLSSEPQLRCEKQ